MRTIIVNGYMYPDVSPDVLTATAPNLTYLSMFTYGITAEGNLIQLDDSHLIQGVKPYGVGPLMVLTAMNEEGGFDNLMAHEVFRDAEKSERLLDQIEATIREKGLAGIDFDFEYLLAEDKEAYAAFIRKTSLRLNPSGYIVMVAAAPKTYADQPGQLYEGHDYRLLGEAANLVLIMTYEWGYTYGPPMAVAPLNQVKRVLNYAVQEIDPEKILMGIPNYGYDWTLPYVPGESRAEKISNTEAAARAERYGAVIQWDEAAQSPWYTYTDAEGRVHEVWFENSASIRAKLNLVEEYGLAGVSYWNLMYYFPENWEALHSMYEPAKITLPNASAEGSAAAQ